MALIPYADEDPRDPRVIRLLGKMAEPRINLFTMLANAPGLAGPTLRLGEAILTKGELDPITRELVILHSARLTDTPYEWAQHEQIARLVDVSEAQIEAIRAGLPSGSEREFTPDQLLALSLTTQLDHNGTPAAELVAEAYDRLGPAKLVEILLIAGFYAMLGGFMRAVRIDIDSVLEKGMLNLDRLGRQSGDEADTSAS
jgi:alkylhydroperoxidase family enzyme